MPDQRSGPLAGVRFVEFAGIGPVPFAAMVLADLGAEGIRIESPAVGMWTVDPALSPVDRGRGGVVVDLKKPAGTETALRLIERADLLLEGFRPGVMERLGLGPDVCLDRNPRLVYGRMTGWGQDGPLAARAGHDLSYLAITGALRHVARAGERPNVPLNLIGDYGGGAMFLVTGLLAGLIETGRSGRGQVVDAAIVDGVALLTALFYGMRAQGRWSSVPGTNLLDSGAPFYDVYRTADDEYLAVGALEPQFYAALLRGLGLTGEELPRQFDVAGWPTLRARFTEVFASRSQAEWHEVFVDTDACVAPVLGFDEAAAYPHVTARDTLIEVGGVRQPAPAPRFSRTPGRAVAGGAPADLTSWGFTEVEVAGLRTNGALPGR